MDQINRDVAYSYFKQYIHKAFDYHSSSKLLKIHATVGSHLKL